MAKLIEYTKIGGRSPIREWRLKLDPRVRSAVDAKIQKLIEYDFMLAKTNMLESIKGHDSDLYELKGPDFRIAAYFDKEISSFVLLWGWTKKKKNHKEDIDYSRHLLHDYVSRKS